MLLIITAIILAILGLVGGIVPVLPGPPLSWLALLCAHFAASPENKFSTFALAIWLVLAIIITIMEYAIAVCVIIEDIDNIIDAIIEDRIKI